MKAAYEAVVHTAVVGPIFLLAGLIEAAARLYNTAADVADRVTGDSPRRPGGLGDLRMA